jgi:AcrR family transcriptional regulator
VTPRPRKDVQRNRALLLTAADRLMAERGIAITFNELAAAAGTGVGTVYRHFADVDDLIGALVEGRLQRAAELLREVERLEDPVEALRQAIERTCTIQQTDRAFWQVVQRAGPQRTGTYEAAFEPVLNRIVQRARATGRVRPDFTATDIMMIFWISGAVSTFTADVRPDVSRRYADALLDGFLTRDQDRTAEVTAPLSEPELRRIAEKGQL